MLLASFELKDSFKANVRLGTFAVISILGKGRKELRVDQSVKRISEVPDVTSEVSSFMVLNFKRSKYVRHPIVFRKPVFTENKRDTKVNELDVVILKNHPVSPVQVSMYHVFFFVHIAHGFCHLEKYFN